MARTLNITIDDFDPLIAYANPLQWTTPNPQDHPSWFNQSQEETGSVWHQATYHQTNVPGAELRFNFTGASLDIYGFSNTSYQIIIDPSISQPYTTNITTSNALASTADSSSRATLFSTTSLSSNAQLSCAQHEVIVRNVGLQEGKGTGVLGVDLVIIGGIPVGGEGATLTNTTIDDPDAALKYTGSWTTNNVTDFWGGSSVYTNTPGDAVALSFAGSAVYVYGDQVNDHGYYSILINNTQMANLSGRSGCAGSDGEKQCEKLGGLHFFAGGLPEGQHDLRIVNGGSSGNQTYFDLDRITYTTPTNYSTVMPLTNLECPFVNCTASSSSATTTPSSSSAKAQTGTSAQGTSTASPTSGGRRTASKGRLGTMLAASVLVLGMWTSM